MCARFAFVVVAVAVAAVGFAQELSEYPPDLPPDFYGIPIDGGRVQSIAVHPTDNRQIITANQFGGLWKTTDAGARWYHLGGLPTIFVVDVAYAADGRTVLATVARDSRVVNSGGIWRSRDGGSTWEKPGTGTPCTSPRIPSRPSAYGISFAPDEPDLVYVGTDYGVAISRDRGANWTHHMLGFPTVDWEHLQDMVRSVLALPGGKALALSRTGIWRSDDRGASWRTVRPGDFTFYWGFKLMDTLPDDPDKVLIVQNYDALLLYEVGAGTFTSIPLPGGGSRGPFIRTSRGTGTNFDVWVGSGVNLRRVTVGSVAALRAVTAASWTSLHRAAGIHDDSGYLGVDASRRPVLYGSDGGVFKPANADATAWTRAGTGATGLNSIQMTDFHAVSVTRPDGSTASVSLYFATQDNALWNSADAGVTWPRAECAEGFFFEGPTRVAEGGTITLAHGKVGCGPSGSMFTGNDFTNVRAVPDVDGAGNPVTAMGQAFYLEPNRWARYRSSGEVTPEIWVSSDDGLHWRKRADVPLEIRGVFQSAASGGGRTLFAPFRGTDRAGGGERIGLLRIDPYAGLASYGAGDLLYLPDGGTLGVRATEFDWHAVYGVDPRDARIIIAPDVHNGVVKVTRDGGMSWTTDHELTDLVTDNGSLLMYDDQYRMQVNDIAFDPFNTDRIFVATRDSGVIVSYDRGANWSRIPGSEEILYGTGFGFEQDRTVYVSSYGRGLWKIEFPEGGGRFRIPRLRDFLLCRGIDCLIPPFPDPRRLREINWAGDPLILVRGGRINGIVADPRGRIQTVSVTPGSELLTYAADAKVPEFKVVQSVKGLGFKGQMKAFAPQGNRAVTGISLQDGLVAYAVQTPRELTSEDIAANVIVDQPQEIKPGAEPYLIITTSRSIPGQPILGEDRLLYIHGFRFPSAQIKVLIDGREVAAEVKASPQGEKWMAIARVPESFYDGLHTVEVIAGNVRAKSTFVIVSEDDIRKK
jgi:photosystem II stability/assembly factor-like uncharacterized protein